MTAPPTLSEVRKSVITPSQIHTWEWTERYGPMFTDTRTWSVTAVGDKVTLRGGNGGATFAFNLDNGARIAACLAAILENAATEGEPSR